MLSVRIAASSARSASGSCKAASRIRLALSVTFVSVARSSAAPPKCAPVRGTTRSDVRASTVRGPSRSPRPTSIATHAPQPWVRLANPPANADSRHVRVANHPPPLDRTLCWMRSRPSKPVAAARRASTTHALAIAALRARLATPTSRVEQLRRRPTIRAVPPSIQDGRPRVRTTPTSGPLASVAIQRPPRSSCSDG
jgi:hypothetical protein